MPEVYAASDEELIDELKTRHETVVVAVADGVLIEVVYQGSQPVLYELCAGAAAAFTKGAAETFAKTEPPASDGE